MSLQRDSASRLWWICRTVYEMMKDRGYLVSKRELDMSLDEFKKQFERSGVLDRSSLTFLVADKSGKKEPLLVYFPEEESVGIRSIKKITEHMMMQNVFNAIIVYREMLTPSATKVMKEMAPKYQIEPFKEEELLVNITKHQLVPKHEILSPEEKELLLKRYKLKETQFPRIFSTDPVARYYGMRHGNVIRIIRPSETAGKYVTYRYCL